MKTEEALKVFYGTIRGGKPQIVNFEDELGGHFGSTKEQAKGAIDRDNELTGENKKGEIKEYYISLENPLRVPDIGRWYPNKVFDEIIEPMGLSYPRTIISPLLGEVEITNRTLEDIINIFRENRYDGLVYENKYEGDGNSYIVFDESQIKPQVADEQVVEQEPTKNWNRGMLI